MNEVTLAKEDTNSIVTANRAIQGNMAMPMNLEAKILTNACATTRWFKVFTNNGWASYVWLQNFRLANGKEVGPIIRKYNEQLKSYNVFPLFKENLEIITFENGRDAKLSLCLISHKYWINPMGNVQLPELDLSASYLDMNDPLFCSEEEVFAFWKPYHFHSVLGDFWRRLRQNNNAWNSTRL